MSKGWLNKSLIGRLKGTFFFLSIFFFCWEIWNFRSEANFHFSWKINFFSHVSFHLWTHHHARMCLAIMKGENFFFRHVQSRTFFFFMLISFCPCMKNYSHHILASFSIFFFILLSSFPSFFSFERAKRAK